MARTAFILTALDCECDAVLEHLADVEEQKHPTAGTVYWVGRFAGWRVAVAEIGAGNTNAAAETERALTHFSPELALFVGVAGGIKDVGLGDVVAATKVYGYHSGKAAKDFEPRPELGECSYDLTQAARAIKRKGVWLQRIENAPQDAPKVLIAPIAAGEQVVASKRSETFRFLRQQFGDAVAVEMEGYGFLRAAFAHSRVKVAVVRGISDLIEKKSQSDAAGSQPQASAHAAAFAFELLARFAGSADPEWTDEATKELSTRLETKLGEREELIRSGADTSGINEVIRDIKRELRRGPERQAGDFVADRYRLIRKIGGGGFATVWEAFDRRSDHRIALKLLHGRFATNRERRDRLFRGARQMAKLDHPHIVRVLDEPGIEDGWAFFTMELLERDLRGAVSEGGLGLAERLDVLDQVAAALEHAHSRDIVHRDVKPGNILLARDGTAKLSDFDLVKALGASTTGATRTHQGMGSYLYAAPEAMLDASKAGPPCDVHGLAVTALFALLGQDPGGLFMGYRDRYFETVDLPVAVRDVLHRAMAPDPAERHTSPSEFCQALRDALAEPGPAVPEPAVPVPAAPVPAAPDPAAGDDSPAPSARRSSQRNAPAGETEDLPAQLERLVESGDRTAVLEAVERSAGTQDLVEIFFLDWALRQVEAADSIPRLYEALPKPSDPELFRVVTTKDGQVDLWRSIPEGRGWIGSDDHYDDEKPRHQVEIVKPFSLAAVPITNAQWAQLDSSNEKGDRPSHPVVEVSWWEAMSFCRWLEHKLGLSGARLPTEEEWEYACRAGTTTRFWSGDTEEDLDRVGWYDDNSSDVQPVGQKDANTWRLYDVHGNVWEWTASPWKADYSGQRDGLRVDPTVEPADLAASPRADRVIRGGGYWDAADWARSAYRLIGDPGIGNHGQGFRVLLPSPERP